MKFLLWATHASLRRVNSKEEGELQRMAQGGIIMCEGLEILKGRSRQVVGDWLWALVWWSCGALPWFAWSGVVAMDNRGACKRTRRLLRKSPTAANYCLYTVSLYINLLWSHPCHVTGVCLAAWRKGSEELVPPIGTVHFTCCSLPHSKIHWTKLIAYYCSWGQNRTTVACRMPMMTIGCSVNSAPWEALDLLKIHDAVHTPEI